jgi:hypothetical protein
MSGADWRRETQIEGSRPAPRPVTVRGASARGSNVRLARMLWPNSSAISAFDIAVFMALI